TPGNGGTCSFSGTAQAGGSGSNGAGGGGGGSTTCTCGWGGPGGAGGNGAAGTVTQKQVPPPNITYSPPMETYFKYDAKGNLLEQKQLHGAGWLYTGYTYDTYGNRLSTTDSLG